MERPHPELEFEARFETPDEFIETIKMQLQIDNDYARHIFSAVTRRLEYPDLDNARKVYLNVLDTTLVVMQFTHFSEYVFTGGTKLTQSEAYDLVSHKISYDMYQGVHEEVVLETLHTMTQIFMNFGERTVQNNRRVSQQPQNWGKQVA